MCEVYDISCMSYKNTNLHEGNKSGYSMPNTESENDLKWLEMLLAGVCKRYHHPRTTISRGWGIGLKVLFVR